MIWLKQDETNKKFWNEYLKGYEFKHSFRRDFAVETTQDLGDKHLFELSEEMTLDLKRLVLKEKSTLFTFLAAALKTLIYKYAKHEDICIGTVNAGRNVASLNEQIGMFVKTLALRTKIDAKQPFPALCHRIQHDLLEIDRHQDVSDQNLINAAFDLLLVYQNPEFSFETINEIDQLNLTLHPVDTPYSRLPLLFNFFESDGKLKAIIEYDTEMYTKETLQIILLKFKKILEQLITVPHLLIDAIDVRLDIEKKGGVKVDFNF